MSIFNQEFFNKMDETKSMNFFKLYFELDTELNK